MDIAISGSSGLIGRALASALARDGHRVVRLVRPATEDAGGDTVAWDPRNGTIDRPGLEGVDAIVNLAGAGVGAGRWNAERKRELFRSRVRGTQLLARTLPTLQAPPEVFVNGSAVGYYGHRGDRELTESDGPGSGYLAEVATAWEEAAAPAREAGIRTVLLRSAHVLAPHGGFLPYLLMPFRFGLGARLGGGRQWFPWITLEDEVDAIRFALEERSVRGPVNAAAPEPVTNRDFTTTLARVLRRPAPWWAPAPVLRALVGAERADQVLLSSAKVVPGTLLRSGFTFTDPQLEPALRRLLGRVSEPVPSPVG
ncbi:MAG TPA: TIGR01777 family oxidoreductase [Actinomycetota bacterium]